MAAKRKLDAKAFAQQKRKRRQWLTFLRMCRYGVNNFSRNAWLTVAATAVMTITLLVIFSAVVARTVLVDTVGDIRDKVDISIYVKNSIEDSTVSQITSDLKALSSVKDVTYVSPDKARDAFAQQSKKDTGTLDALNEATNQFPGTFRVKVADIDDTAELRKYTETNQIYKENRDDDRAPSFAGERSAAIATIAKWASFAEKLGLGAGILFVAISSLIVFNTIRMAIFNRKDEIQMMKLIGADRNFIRGPFVVEAVVYGFIAAVAATAIGMVILYSVKDKLIAYGIAMQGAVDVMTMYIGLVLLGMIIAGAIIGVVSSLFATHKYLKI